MVNTRNEFIRGQGGFDTFAEMGQYVEGVKDRYDKMEEDVTRNRAEFDEKVIDKESFVAELRDDNREDLADLMARMFRLTKLKKGLFSSWRK